MSSYIQFINGKHPPEITKKNNNTASDGPKDRRLTGIFDPVATHEKPGWELGWPYIGLPASKKQAAT